MPSGSPLVTYDGTLRVSEMQRAEQRAATRTNARLFIAVVRELGPSPILFPFYFSQAPARAGFLFVPADRQTTSGLLRLEYFTIDQLHAGFGDVAFHEECRSVEMGGAWTNEGTFTALMSWQVALAGYPLAAITWQGRQEQQRHGRRRSAGHGGFRPTCGRRRLRSNRVSQSESPL